MPLNTLVEKKVPTLNQLVNAIADFNRGKITENELKKIGYDAQKASGKTATLLQKIMGVIAYTQAGEVEGKEARWLVLNVTMILENHKNQELPDEIAAAVVGVLDMCYMTAWRDLCKKYDAKVFSLSDEDKEIFATFEETLNQDDRDWVKELPEVKETVEYYNTVKWYMFEKQELDGVRTDVLELMEKLCPEYVDTFAKKYDYLGYDIVNEMAYRKKIDLDIQEKENGIQKRQKMLDDFVDKGYILSTQMANLWNAFSNKKSSIEKKPNDVQSYRDFVNGVRVAIKQFDNEPTFVRAKNLVENITNLQQVLQKNIKTSYRIERTNDYVRWDGWVTPRPEHGPKDKHGGVGATLYFDGTENGYEYIPVPEIELSYYNRLNNMLYSFISKLVDNGYVPKEVKGALWENGNVPNKEDLIKNLQEVTSEIDKLLAENDKFLKRQSLPEKLKGALDKEPPMLYGRR